MFYHDLTFFRHDITEQILSQDLNVLEDTLREKKKKGKRYFVFMIHLV